MHAIEVHDVWKRYRRYGRRKSFGTLKSALLGGGLRAALSPDESFDALRGVSVDVERGRTVGLIGRNGSGKSTLLKLIAGIGKPTTGRITVHGRVSALIELGAGFHPEISGRENVFINGMMLGLSRREVADRFAAIEAFAEIGDFIDAPVKTYSSGMYMRLGFAVAINVDPDVLLVDEVLAVGDEAFTHRCLDKFAEFRRRGRTVLLVTHNPDLVARFCDDAIWLDEGQLKAHGDPRRVIDAYLMDVAAGEGRALENASRTSTAGVEASASSPPGDMFQAQKGRWGTREAELVEVTLRCGAGGLGGQVLRSGEALEIRMHARAAKPLSDFAFGVAIFNADGVCCYGTNTLIEGGSSGQFAGEGHVTFTIPVLPLLDGLYTVDVAVHRQDGVPYDYHRQLHAFRVQSSLKDTGVFRPPHRWAFSGGIRVSGVADLGGGHL
jgi:ABC-type polysaccharide/polyol phosphate transport system ATPase subunit